MRRVLSCLPTAQEAVARLSSRGAPFEDDNAEKINKRGEGNTRKRCAPHRDKLTCLDSEATDSSPGYVAEAVSLWWWRSL